MIPNFIFFSVRDALRKYSDEVAIEKDGHAIRVRFPDGKAFLIAVHETSSAGKGRPNPDELRIQTDSSQQKTIYDEEGTTGAILGFHPKLQVFSAWEPGHLKRNNSNFSVYTSGKDLSTAKDCGLSIRWFRSNVLGRKSRCINFHENLLGIFLECNSELWKDSNNDESITGLFLSGNEQEEMASDSGNEMPEPPDTRPQYVTARSLRRDPMFRERIIRAYGHKCCICELSLGVVEAAHIVPFADHRSDNHVSNGLALCPNHHELFDSGLIALRPDCTIAISSQRYEFLKQNNRTEGLKDVDSLKGKSIRPPEKPQDRPNVEKIKLGNRLRNFTLER